ncbi:hypothetical protein HS125_01820 [bacterium]|nr:hypothetical protein [bacterium]
MKALIAYLAALVFCFAWCLQVQAAPALAQFDEDVARCRRLIRDYCAIVQEITKQPELDQPRQQHALELLGSASREWQQIKARYAADPPAEYARDPQFKARLKDIDNALDDMERNLAQGQARRSFQACGFGCGLFVKMHQENGLAYALDKLFALRQTAKTAESVMKTAGIAGVREWMPALMQQRDEVLLAPAPWPEGDERSQAYRDAVLELSRAIDDLALAASDGDADQVSAGLQALVARVNKPYTLAL